MSYDFLQFYKTGTGNMVNVVYVLCKNAVYELRKSSLHHSQVRHHLAQYIESRSWMSVAPTRAQEELGGLINALDNKVRVSVITVVGGRYFKIFLT